MRTDTTTSLLVQRLLPLTNTQTTSTQETYSIVSATEQHISISNIDDDAKEIKMIPTDLIEELAKEADISHEDSFELIATLVIKRDCSDMSLTIIIQLLQKYPLEKCKALLVEYGESESYLEKIIKQDDEYSKLERQFAKVNDDFIEDDFYSDNNLEQQEDYAACEYTHICSRIDSLPLNLSRLYQCIASKECIPEKKQKYRYAKSRDKKRIKKILESKKRIKRILNRRVNL